MTFCVFALVLVTYWVLWRTTFGLRLRSCGENPQAAEILGVNVLLHKYAAVLVSGGLAGLGGGLPGPRLLAGLPYQSDQRPRLHRPGGDDLRQLAARAVPCSARACSATPTASSCATTRPCHALSLSSGSGCWPSALWQILQARTSASGIVLGLRASVFVLWFTLTDTVPRDFTSMTPYVATLLVLAFASQRLRMPKADGQIYRKGSVG